MYKEKIINIQTNEETYRDYTDAEIAKVEAAQAEAAQAEVKAQAKKAARQAVYAKLGITADEAKLLLS